MHLPPKCKGLIAFAFLICVFRGYRMKRHDIYLLRLNNTNRFIFRILLYIIRSGFGQRLIF